MYRCSNRKKNNKDANWFICCLEEAVWDFQSYSGSRYIAVQSCSSSAQPAVVCSSQSQSYCLSCRRSAAFPLLLLRFCRALIRSQHVWVQSSGQPRICFPQHLSGDLSLPSRLHHDLGRPFTSGPNTECWESPDAGLWSGAKWSPLWSQLSLSWASPRPPWPLCPCCDWCLFRPAEPPPSIKKKSLTIPLAFTLTRLFLLNTHDNTQPWLHWSFSYFSQISLRILPFKAFPPRFLFSNHDTDLREAGCPHTGWV